MKEIRDIVQAYHQTVSQGRKMALATVVQVDGSSYRRAGARMLVDDEGVMTGAISGGCLEGDALRKAQLVISRGLSAVVVYDTSDEDDVSIGVQLGCAGVIHVLFEPIGKEHHVIDWFEQIQSSRHHAVLVTAFSTDRSVTPLGTCMLLRAGEDIASTIPPGLQKKVQAAAVEALEKQQGSHLVLQHEAVEMIFFLEYLPAPVLLVVVGAGNDAIPLVDISTALGWDVKVVDGRGTHARPERFASACQVLVSKPERVLEEIGIDDRTFFVLMTHNYRYDLAMLKALLLQPVRYVGILGPRKKLERMLDELEGEGMVITDEMRQKIYGPVGLELGAETSSEIALSIVAEILAVVQQASGQSLRHRQQPIHSK